ncbi:MAG: hypothetical protein ACRC2R_19520 [Xenococcaceae cyanobacterium]
MRSRNSPDTIYISCFPVILAKSLPDIDFILQFLIFDREAQPGVLSN